MKKSQARIDAALRGEATYVPDLQVIPWIDNVRKANKLLPA